jgi:hypothetical protein
VAEIDKVKKAVIAAAISAYLSEEGVGGRVVFRPTMFLRSTEGSGAWGRLSRRFQGGTNEYRSGGLCGSRMFFGDIQK